MCMDPISVGQRIHAACRARNVTPAQLAAAIGKHRTTPRKWLVRKQGPSMRTLQLVAEYLGMSVAEILTTPPVSESSRQKAVE